MSKVKYVMVVVFDPSLGHVLGITKLKGPEFLRGKVSFPGGRVEDGESTQLAASRETFEETGLSVPLGDWIQVDQLIAADREMTTFAAVSDKFFCARKCEVEPVWHLSVSHHQLFAKQQPAQYAPDFLEFLALGLKAAQALECATV